MSENEIIERVRNVIDECFGEELVKSIENVENDENLYNIGLDSLNVVKLVVGLEDEFDIEFEDDDIAGGNWKNINIIVELLKKRCE